MEMGSFAFVVVGFFVLILVIAYYQKKAADARRAAMAAYASANGLQFLPGQLMDSLSGSFFDALFGNNDGGPFLSRFQGFEPFGKGHSPMVENLIYGKKGELDWAIFDYSYKETHSNGKTTSTSTYPFTVAVSRMPVLLPPLTLRPENFFNRIGTKLGMQDIQFESEEFNRKYLVQCQDPKGAFDVLHPQAIQLLMGMPSRLWQMAGYQILLVQSGHADVSAIAEMVSEIEAFCSLLPAYVKEDRGFTAKFEQPF